MEPWHITQKVPSDGIRPSSGSGQSGCISKRLTVPVSGTVSSPEWPSNWESAQSLSGAPVTMAGTGPGSWMGIVFRAAGAGTATGNVHYLHLSGGGGRDPSVPVNAGIFVTASSPTISNSTVDTTAGNGIEIDSSRSAPILSFDTLTNNTGYAIQYDFLSTTLTNISGVTMSGNGHNAVRMVNATATQYMTNVTWPNLGYPLIDDISTAVLHAGHLTVAPGVTVEFGKSSAFQVVNRNLVRAVGTHIWHSGGRPGGLSP